MVTSFSSDRVIVKLNPTANASEITNLQSEIGVTQVTKASQLGIDIWQIPSGTVEQTISAYKDDPRFEYIEPDYIITLDDVQKPSSTQESSGKITPQATTPNDPSYSQLWGLNNTGQDGGTPDADIDAPEAWDIQKGDPNLVIGVIDTGVDYDHPDLSANIWTNPGEIAGDGIDNDSNGYTDDVRGWDFAYNDNNPMDVDGHGTHVAGTIAGKGNNGVGVTGVAWNAKIMPLKYLDDNGDGFTSNAILAINYATAKGVKLTNNSWGGGGRSQALYDAINTAGQQGALFIASAGNESNNNDANPAYPASYDLANIISVASTTRTDGLSSFSNYGATTVDLGAPGSSIYSTLPNSSYGTKSGTSMASPQVTGAAALLWSQNPTWTAQQVKNKLMQTTDPISALSGKTVTGGRLNINNALASSDTTAPTASSFTPTDDATNIAVGADLVANFSEAIQKGTGDIVIKKLSDNSVVETIAVTNSNVTVSGSQLTINPTNDLAQTTDYYVEIANGAIKDIAGNNYAGITGNSTWNFTTVAPPDTTPPTASSFTPTDDATNIAVGADLVANFSETIQKGTGDIVIKKLSDNSVVETIAVTNSNVTVSGSQLTINPTNDLAQSTDYYVEIANGAIKDIAGNNYAGITGNSTWNFTTVAPPDTTPPAASSFTPVDNATGIAVGADLVVNFSEAIQKSTGDIVIKKLSDNSVVETIAVTNSNVTVSGSQLTINPTNDLAQTTDYYVEIANGAIKDIAGNNYAGITGNSIWNFQTADTTAPTASSFTPTDDATNIAVGADLVVNFSETIQKSTGDIVIKKLSDNSVVETIAVTAANVTLSGSQLTINPTNDLAQSTDYYVEIANGAIKDIAGNNYAGITGNSTWNFTTVAPPDTTPPATSSFTPVDNATGIAVGADLVVNFSETIQKSTGDIVIKKLSDNSVVETIAVTNSNVTVSGSQLTINPTNDLAQSTDYYVEIANGAIKDIAGNNYAGITGNSTWNFTTVAPPDTTPPAASSFTPVDNATGIAVGADLVVNFSEAIQKGTGDIVIKKLSDNSVVETIAVTNSNVTVSGSQLTINPTNDLAQTTDYYVEIANGAIKDIAGNNYAGITGNSTWNFTTVAPPDTTPPATTPPAASSFTPVDNATGIAVGADLVVNFSEAIQKSTGDIVIKKLSDNSVVETIAVTNSNVTVSDSQLTINPTNDLAQTTDYYVEIANGAIKDIAGNNYAGITGNSIWNFQTADTTAPTASSFTPTDDATNIAVGADLVVNFSETIQKSTGDIVIKKLSDNSVVETIAVTAANVTLSGSQLTINPTNDLAQSTDYYVEIANGAIKDIAGNNYAGITGNSTWNFTTVAPPDTTPPATSSFTPVDNATGIAVGADLVVNFSETIQKSTGDIVIKKLSDNSVVETIAVTNSNVTVSGSQLTINPTNDLAQSTDYYVEIANGAIKDIAGNNYAGITGNSTWNFTTVAPPDTTPPATTPPAASSFTPVDNATGIAVGADLVVNFSEAIQKSTGDIVIKKLSDNSVVETIAVTNSNVTVSDSQLTINPTANLATGTDYYIGIANGAIKDTAGNNYAGITGNSIWNFKTQGTPVINGTANNDILTGTANPETINGLGGNNKLSGLGGNDTLNGGAGNDTLNGGAGSDQLKGGTGNDTYVVDNAGDIVTELAAQGTDLVQSSIAYTLPANVENLTLTGTTAINGTGNGLANTINGNNANNTLNGSTGNDLILGNGGVDKLLGGAGNDSLNGGAGNDTLTGGLGADKFIYNTNAAFTTTAVGVDTITDFNISQTDQIVLDKTTFTSISSAAGTEFSVASGEFAKVTSDALAATSAADIVYNTTTGALFYNQNGTAVGFGTGAKFLTLTNQPILITENQFLIQA
ncbi:Thermitase [Planktothrix rubescens]|nr:Thermitase [Planktothrix rubescens]